MQIRHICLAGERFVSIYGEGTNGEPGRQLLDLTERIERELSAVGLSLDDAVFHRLWSRSRHGRDAVTRARSQQFSGTRRTASSSFISERRFSGLGDIAIELVAKRNEQVGPRRIVDSNPPRRYAHYLAAGDWLFLSGMAEEAETIEEKFRASLTQVEQALRAEQLWWPNVVDVALFVERGRAAVDWLCEAFAAAIPQCTARVTTEEVDGLASVDKHLEIEIVAHRSIVPR